MTDARQGEPTRRHGNGAATEQGLQNPLTIDTSTTSSAFGIIYHGVNILCYHLLYVNLASLALSDVVLILSMALFPKKKSLSLLVSYKTQYTSLLDMMR